MTAIDNRKSNRAAVCGVLLAYTWWGISPLYFRLLANIDSFEIIAHRTLWTLILLGAIKAFGYGRGVLRARFRQPAQLLPSLVASLCLLSNWWAFTWAVTNNYILDTSLGYFINPLFSVLLGVLFLGERLRPWQLVAVAIATGGVAQLVWREGHLPVLALFLAISWALYGYFRKRAPIDAINGLTIELLLGLPLALGYELWKLYHCTLHFGPAHPFDSWMLLLAGPVTLIPLLLFGYAAKRINLITIGIMQYITPSLSFLLAVFAFHEPFDHVKLLAFALIWVALVLYTVDSLVGMHYRKDAAAEPVPVD